MASSAGLHGGRLRLVGCDGRTGSAQCGNAGHVSFVRPSCEPDAGSFVRREPGRRRGRRAGGGFGVARESSGGPRHA